MTIEATVKPVTRTMKGKPGPGAQINGGLDNLPPVKTSPPPEPNFAFIDVADIVVTDKNDRDQAKTDQVKLLELAADIERRGLKQPIGVKPIGDGSGKYELVWGERRLKAFQLKGWPRIPVVLNPALEREDVLADRFAENLHRADPTAIEQAITVAELFDAIEPAVRQEFINDAGVHGHPVPDFGDIGMIDAVRDVVIERIAEKMSKSPVWIRERLYLSKLGKPERELVSSGRLPLPHAMLICKLADPSLRSDLAKSAAKDEHGDYGWDLSHVRRYVDEHLLSLKTVPWQLDQPLAGKPACSKCPANSANHPKLFLDLGDSDAQFCSNEGCFRIKEKAAESQIGRAVEKIAKVVDKAKDTPITETAMSDLLPPTIKPSRVISAARRSIQPEKKGEAGGTIDKPKLDPKIEAGRKLEEAQHKWRNNARKLILRFFDENPLSAALFFVSFEYLLAAGDLAFSSNDKFARKCLDSKATRAMLSALHSPTIDDFEGSGEQKSLIDRIDDLLRDAHDLVTPAIVKTLDLSTDIEPKLEDFLKPEAPKPDKSVKRKANPKKKTSEKKRAKTAAIVDGNQGGGRFNSSGVIENPESIKVFDKGKVKVILRVGSVDEQDWRSAIHVTTGTSSTSSLPGKHDKPHKSRDAAIRAAAVQADEYLRNQQAGFNTKVPAAALKALERIVFPDKPKPKGGGASANKQPPEQSKLVFRTAGGITGHVLTREHSPTNFAARFSVAGVGKTSAFTEAFEGEATKVSKDNILVEREAIFRLAGHLIDFGIAPGVVDQVNKIAREWTGKAAD